LEKTLMEPGIAVAAPGSKFARVSLFVVALAIVLLGVFLKLQLLATSQSLADGDEAVEGVMALHILNDGEHPIYPQVITVDFLRDFQGSRCG
jgi:hypothetical protein